MKYYTVIDTNVLVSAMLKWNSVPGNIMELAFSGPIIPVLNEDIVKEYREVLLRPKFHLTEEIVNDVLDTINEKGIYVDADTIDIELPDPKDRVFYEVVMEKRKEENAYLVTGNIKHFPTKPFIVTPRQLLDIISYLIRNDNLQFNNQPIAAAVITIAYLQRRLFCLYQTHNFTFFSVYKQIAIIDKSN